MNLPYLEVGESSINPILIKCTNNNPVHWSPRVRAPGELGWKSRVVLHVPLGMIQNHGQFHAMNRK